MNIETVTKSYNFDGIFDCYIVTYTDDPIQISCVPHDENNRHYQMIMEWVAEGNTITDNGGSE